MAINPRELRIGNWVRHSAKWSYRQPNNGPCSEFDFQWEERDWYAIGECTFDFELIRPIPLTEEWIKRKPSSIKKWKGNGADYQPETSKTRQAFYELSDCISLVFQTWSWRKTEDSEWTHDHSILLEFHHEFIHLTKNEVHTLQNLYFGLTGEELDFNNAIEK